MLETKITYSPITEVFDWGPDTTKVVLHFEEIIKKENLLATNFKATVVNFRVPFETLQFLMGGGKTEPVPVEEETTRTITRVYASDEKGKEILTDSKNITLEMKVSPRDRAFHPLAFNFKTGHNDFSAFWYHISGVLENVNNEKINIIETTKADMKKHIKPISDKFTHNIDFVYYERRLKYGYYTPENVYNEDRKNPLIIWLHGAGEGGTNTEVTLANKVTNIADDEIQGYFDNAAYVLVPQTPTMWMDKDGKGNYITFEKGATDNTYYEEALIKLIENFVDNNPKIDRNRIYIGGCSNGGYMTVKMLVDNPHYFAAAYPVCAAYGVNFLDDKKINDLKNIPIWFTQSKDDPVVAVSKTKGKGKANGFIAEFELDENDNYIPVDEFSVGIVERIKDGGKVHHSLYNEVIDTSGKYLDENGNPYKYNGHFSWVYTLDNKCTQIIDGKEITIFEWLSKQSK